MFIEQPPWFYRALFPGVIWRIPAKKKCVYLTFDDGPIPEVTPWVLDILDKYGVKATFFCVGDNVRKHPDIYQMVLDRGASCRQSHFQPYSRYPLLDQELSGECGKGCRIYKKRPVPSAPRTHAFPTGGRTQEALPDHHVGRGDARLQSAHDTERCLQRGEELYPQRISVIVFHDSLKAERNMREAMPRGHRMATGTRV